nr:relaxase/mobilization nuclease domain-containing protein [uncultured Rhodococcus sp.]
MTGLVVYLAGPGKSNEHENPHVVAGHESVVFAAPAGELSHEDAIALAGELDTARVVFGTEVSVTSRRKMNAALDDGVPRSVALADATSDQNVWHCSLSLNPNEGELSDEKWATIAADFMKEMDFDDADSPRAPARWVAIRHGKTTAGGDHIHIAASAVREDGTKVNTFNDRKRAQAACNTLEHRYGLEVLQSREQQLGGRGTKPAEQGRADRAHLPETGRDVLERRVRAAATASTTEAEFVRRLRGSGVLVRPRFTKGTTDAVEGYSVALRPNRGEAAAAPVWYGGGKLSKDLTLPRLRSEWDTSSEQVANAVDEWTAAKAGKPARRSGPEAVVADPRLLARAAEDLERWNDYLTSIPVTDRAQWARAAGRTSGVFAAWSAKVETRPGPLAHASKQLARAAQLPAHQRAAKPAGVVSAGGAALIVMACKPGLDATTGYILLLRQLMKATEAIAAASRAAGDASYAHDLEIVTRERLSAVHSRLEATQPAPGQISVAVAERDGTAAAREVTYTETELADAEEAARVAYTMRSLPTPHVPNSANIEQARPFRPDKNDRERGGRDGR